MATVYLAQDVQQRRLVALKVLDPPVDGPPIPCRQYSTSDFQGVKGKVIDSLVQG
jgi:hypothetical protein